MQYGYVPGNEGVFWKIIGPHIRARGRGHVLCECACGRQATVACSASGGLRSSKCRWCGALEHVASATAGMRRTRGTPKTNGHHVNGKPSRTAKSWESMKRRCGCPQADNYYLYGGRGVRVCERWETSFENFLADMGERPEGMTLDRYPNTDGNYEPGNVRWATPTKQQRNRRFNVTLTFGGETKTLAEWSEIHRISVALLRCRMAKGWSAERCLTQPVGTKNLGKKCIPFRDRPRPEGNPEP